MNPPDLDGLMRMLYTQLLTSQQETASLKATVQRLREPLILHVGPVQTLTEPPESVTSPHG
jgi:hypothetical protein